MTGEVRIGTSGWHYDHWRGPFYPAGLPSGAMLGHYQAHFDTVELNNSFYRLPTLTAAAAWRDGTPPGFKLAVKASRYITHMKKLADPQSALARFFPVVDTLRDRAGPVLFQLPPRWRVDTGRLEAFLGALPRHHRYAFELRDPSWLSEDVYAVLRRHEAAFCIYELDGFATPREVTADFTYVRLHGPDGKYAGSYTEGALRAWAEQIRTWIREVAAVYVYFDNDQAGHAVANARDLKRMLGLGTASPGRFFDDASNLRLRQEGTATTRRKYVLGPA